MTWRGSSNSTFFHRTTNYTNTRCQGGENFSDHCTHNGPSIRVWLDILMVAFCIAAFFVGYVKWAARRRNIEDIDWWGNDDDTFTTEEGSTASEDNTTEKHRNHHSKSMRQSQRTSRRQLPYYHMHPGYNARQQQFHDQQQNQSSRSASKGQQILAACSTTSSTYRAPSVPFAAVVDAPLPTATSVAGIPVEDAAGVEAISSAPPVQTISTPNSIASTCADQQQ